MRLDRKLNPGRLHRILVRYSCRRERELMGGARRVLQIVSGHHRARARLAITHGLEAFSVWLAPSTSTPLLRFCLPDNRSSPP
jgi:hypothetical protein